MFSSSRALLLFSLSLLFTCLSYAEEMTLEKALKKAKEANFQYKEMSHEVRIFLEDYSRPALR